MTDRLLIHARRLRRERDEARNAMAQAQGELDLKTLDFERMREQRDQLSKQLAAERALADRLADALISTDAIIRKEVSLVGQWDSPVIFKEALAAWKEARND